MSVDAPFDRTWTALIDVFGDRNVPIRTLERASGFVATDRLTVGAHDGVVWADCGTDMGERLPAEYAIYNVRVRGDSVQSTVQVTVLWTASYQALRNSRVLTKECVSTGIWEQESEAAIKLRAEAH
jgi:hypothetical protein